MSTVLNRLLFCVALSAMFTTSVHTPSCYAGGGNPLIVELTTSGVKTAEGKSLPLPMPTLTDTMSARQQTIVVSEIAAEKGEDRFFRDSTVSPFVLKIESLEKLKNRAQVQRIDIYFAVHGTLADIENKRLLEDLATPDEPSASNREDDQLPSESRELTDAELAAAKLSRGEQPDGTTVNYGILQGNVLDKVFLSLLTKSQAAKTNQSLSFALRLDPSLSETTNIPSQWYPIDDDRQGKLRRGAPETYYTAGAYIKVTDLKDRPGVMFVEIHVLFVEPHDWFRGRNLLRSKLPPVIQEVVRTFRRKVAGSSR